MASASGRLELPAKIFILPSTAGSPNAPEARFRTRTRRGHSSRPAPEQHDGLITPGERPPDVHRKEALWGVAEGRAGRRGFGGVREKCGEIVGAFSGDAVERRIVHHRPRIVARALDRDRVAEPPNALLVRREDVPNDVDRRSALNQGSGEI